MKKLHHKLERNVKWYASWHKAPYSTVIHYFLLLAFVIFMGMNFISLSGVSPYSLTGQVGKPFEDLNFKDRIVGKREVKGEEAIKALGNDVSRVASYYGKSRQELEHALRNSDSLRISKDALLFYAETELPPQEITPGDGTLGNNPSVADIPDATTFLLHSKPNATAKIYLNFQGATVANTSWNYAGPIVAVPFSVDSDSAFNADELARIKATWRNIAEDYSPFDVDVTTEQPINPDLNHYTQVIFTPSSAWYGNVGGVAFIGSFRWGDNTPSWVFSTLLGNNVKNISEAGSHEAGHTMGLYHVARYDAACVKLSEYHSGGTPWAPIMGVGYYQSVTQWANTNDSLLLASPYGCNSEQVDTAIITGTALSNNGDLRFVNDEAGASTTSAGNLTRTVVSGVANVDHLGVMSLNDTDLYRINTLEGDIQFVANPMTPTPQLGNADFRVRLLDGGMNVLSESNPDAVASVSVSKLVAPAGVYYLEISPSGYLNSYTASGSMGQYQVVGTYNSGAGDSISPIVGVSSPTSGNTVSGNVTIVASATDNIKVTKMEIFIDGAIKKSSTSGTISYKWSTGKVAKGTHNILFKAYDQAGNMAEKSIVVYK